MLYDPKWEVKADPFSLESLIAWLEKQPAPRFYNYGCNGHCLLAQYFSAMGFADVNMGSAVFVHGSDTRTFQALPDDFNDIALCRRSRFGEGDMTFGAALTRAREALASR